MNLIQDHQGCAPIARGKPASLIPLGLNPLRGGNARLVRRFITFWPLPAVQNLKNQRCLPHLTRPHHYLEKPRLAVKPIL